MVEGILDENPASRLFGGAHFRGKWLKIFNRMQALERDVAAYDAQDTGIEISNELMRCEAKLLREKLEKRLSKDEARAQRKPPLFSRERKLMAVTKKLAAIRWHIADYDEARLGFDSYHDQLKGEAKLLEAKKHALERKTGPNSRFLKLALPLLAAASISLFILLNQLGIGNILENRPGPAKPQPKPAAEEPFQRMPDSKPGYAVPGIGRFVPENTGGFSQAPAANAQKEAPAASNPSASLVPAPAATQLAQAGASAVETFTVPDGGGFWHIGEKIAQSRLSGLESLPRADRECVIGTIMGHLIENQARLGVAASEAMHGNGLLKGADLVFKDSDWKAASARLPRRILDSLNGERKAFSAPKIQGAASKAIGLRPAKIA
ncbi:MAG: hypothetical protein WC588_04980 [Candidatus Micrarchaeia archaeon]